MRAAVTSVRSSGEERSGVQRSVRDSLGPADQPAASTTAAAPSIATTAPSSSRDERIRRRQACASVCSA